MDVFKFLHLSSTNLRAKMFGAEAKSKNRLWRFKCSKEQERKSGCVWFLLYLKRLSITSRTSLLLMTSTSRRLAEVEDLKDNILNYWHH